MTRRLLNLEAAIGQRNLATLVVLCIEWSTGRTKLYLYAWVLWMWRVKVPRRRKLLVKPWPVLYMTDWARLCFENSKYNGFFFLGGNTLDTWDDAQAMLQTFWGRYKTLILVLCQSIPLKLFRSTSMEMKEGAGQKTFVGDQLSANYVMDWWTENPVYQVPLLIQVAICCHAGIRTNPQVTCYK